MSQQQASQNFTYLKDIFNFAELKKTTNIVRLSLYKKEN
jgi:hypothetical protein